MKFDYGYTFFVFNDWRRFMFPHIYANNYCEDFHDLQYWFWTSLNGELVFIELDEDAE